MQNRNFFGAQIVHIPLLQELKNRYPNASITIFSKTPLSQILLDLKIVDNLVLEHNKVQTFRKYLKEKPDLTLNLRKKSLFISFYISFFNFQTKIGFDNFLSKIFFTISKPHNQNIYRAQNYLTLLNSQLQYSNYEDHKKICFMPGAGGDFKMWPIHNYIKLAEFCAKKYPQYTIEFILGKKEKSFIEKIPQHFNVVYNLPIKELFENICKASLVIANDCGPSHIAQINNIKTLILVSDEYNDADAVIKEWVNTTSHIDFIKGKNQQSIQTLSLESVQYKVQKLLEK